MMYLYAIKAKAALLGHVYYCSNRCGWTGTPREVGLLPKSSRNWNAQCPECQQYAGMKFVHKIKVKQEVSRVDRHRSTTC